MDHEAFINFLCLNDWYLIDIEYIRSSNLCRNSVKNINQIFKEKTLSCPETCAICLDKVYKVAIISCRHNFCISCLKPWTIKNNSCPLCRQKI